MRIYLAPCGIGLGHASRCLAIARKLLEMGHEVLFSTYGEALRFIECNGFKALPTSAIEYELKPDGSIDVGGTIAKGPKIFYNFSRQLGAELYYVTTLLPNVVVSDSRITPSLAALSKGLPHALITNQLLVLIPSKTERKGKSVFENFILDVMMTIWKRSNVIIIPDFPPPYTISKRNLVFDEDYENKVFLVGPIILRTPEELPSRKALREKMVIDEDVKLVLVSPSGTRKEKEVILGYLKEVLLKIDLDEYYFVISEGKVGAETKLTKLAENVVSYSWLPNKFELLKAADAVICHGGHTTIAEAMYYGVPMIVIPNEGHTERLGNARSVEELGIAKVIRSDRLDKDVLRRALTEICEGEFKKRASKVSREVAIFNGAKTSAEIIDKLARDGEP